MLLDDVGGLRVRSHARSRVGLHDCRFRDHSVTIVFFFGVSSNEQVIVKNYLQLGKKSSNHIRERERKPVLF